MDRTLLAATGIGLLVAISTEALGALNLLRPWTVRGLWIAAGLAGIGALARVRWRWPRLKLFQWLAAGGIAAVLAVVALTALLSAPNSADAMAYHLPRVVYWMQAGNVQFFSTPYYNQVMLAPLAEYFMLHSWLLSGSDRFVNLVQWFGCAVSVLAAFGVARNFGGRDAGPWVAALYCVTLPNGILQASGAKNDYLLSAWLLCAVYHAQRGAWRWVGCAAGLAMLTKATAYLFLPAALALFVRPKHLPAILFPALLLNAPHYFRNYELSGSVLGYDSAHGDGRYRWRNERIGIGETVSNALRHAGEQLGARSEAWNERVYRAVLAIHERWGMDASDPATTWPETRYRAPRNTNHEADAANRWHLLIAAGCFAAALFRHRRMALYFAALCGGFVLFSAYLKWQLFLQRLLLPLFVLASPAVGRMLDSRKTLSIALCVFLLNNGRPYLFENWTRRLEGPGNLWSTPREEQYFQDMVQWGNKPEYLALIEEAKRSGCRKFAVDLRGFELEYPFQIAMLRHDAGTRFAHVPWDEACGVVRLGTMTLERRNSE